MGTGNVEGCIRLRARGSGNRGPQKGRTSFDKLKPKTLNPKPSILSPKP